MPCPSESPPLSQLNVAWNNWSGEQPYVVGRYFRPADLEGLVWVVERAEQENVRLKAVGSGWAFEDIAVSSDWIVDIGNLDADLGQSVINITTLNPDWARQLPSMLVHIEAGITIWALNAHLATLERAMPSLGGSGGQTLAGATSTSTHGGDFEFGPIHDRIRAIHLVSQGGQEYWIEPETRSLTGIMEGDELVAPESLRDALPCSDTVIRYDDHLFRAVLVGCGRFGVIYSFVVEVYPAFRLVQSAEELQWSTVRERLLDDFAPANTLLAPDGDMARFVDVLLSPHTNPSETCIVRRRWVTEEDSDPDQGPQVFDILCSVANVGVILAGVIAGLSAAIALTAAIPLIGPLLAIPLSIALATVTALVPASGLTIGELLATVTNVLNGVGQGELVRRLIPEIFAMQVGSGESKDEGHVIMTGTAAQEGSTRCYRSNSLEAIFPEDDKSYVRFIDELQVQAVGRAARSMVVPGYLSIRFSKPSDALISMHNFDAELAASVEVSVLQNVAGNDEWMLLVEQTALRHGGILHWGQHNTLIQTQVEAFYGDRLIVWREKLAELVGTSMTFSNNYTRRRGLEPIGVELPAVVVVTCVERRVQDWDTCIATEDQGYETCSQQQDQGWNTCVATADQGYNSCAAQADLGYNSCCTWWPCSWFCSAFVWISNVVCVAWTWVSNIVCIAWNWVVNLVCVAWTWVSKLVCVAWAWLTFFVCTVTGRSP